jgi:hypothetical protein
MFWGKTKFVRLFGFVTCTNAFLQMCNATSKVSSFKQIVQFFFNRSNIYGQFMHADPL